MENMCCHLQDLEITATIAFRHKINTITEIHVNKGLHHVNQTTIQICINSIMIAK